ncbi:frr [Scenedesmus sp. PABB004]|nr:frr [Scenedesmus sp. PABB004]
MAGAARARLGSLLALARAAEGRASWAAASAGSGLLNGWGGAAVCCAAGAAAQQRQQQQALLRPWQGFAAHYAKGKARKGGGGGKAPRGAAGDDSDDAGGEGGEEPEYDPSPFEAMMQTAVQHFLHELAGVRSGRATPGLIENITVDAAGDHLPVKACGSVTVRGPQLLAVALFDPGLAKAVEKAIRDSPLGLAPASEGGEVLVKLPRMTNETIDRLVKLVRVEAEGAHVSVRHARQKGMEAIRRAFKAASADDKKRAEKELQKLHDQYVAEVERLTKQKDAELRQHRD